MGMTLGAGCPLDHYLNVYVEETLPLPIGSLIGPSLMSNLFVAIHPCC